MKLKTLYCIAIIAILTNGCGNSSTDSSDSSLTGTFIDAPVYGLKYKTNTHEGYTDENGTFQYEKGETVRFYIDTLKLGEVNGSDFITPYTLAGVDELTPNTKAENIALMLQNFDCNKDDNGTINLSKMRDLNDSYSLEDVNLSDETSVYNKVCELMADNDFVSKHADKEHTTVLTKEEVRSRMEAYIKEHLNKVHDDMDDDSNTTSEDNTTISSDTNSDTHDSDDSDTTSESNTTDTQDLVDSVDTDETHSEDTTHTL